ncbi:MAG TPA: DoxX family protein [Caldimonas sp.]|nr:DoxX family protein [Caldimonas sp.]
MGARGELQLLLVRLCAGLAFVPASVPKLFDGLAVRARIAQQLSALGVTHAVELVVLAGVAELALGGMLVLGCATRLAAVLAALYLAAVGYFFPSENVIVWLLVCLSFAVGGGGRWSVDRWLRSVDAPPSTPP